MKYGIDEIIEMLDWNNSYEVQKKGIELAKKIKYLHIFVQPPYGKKYWENCAKVISFHSDSELENVLPELFQWISDLNWPGAEKILVRLNEFERTTKFIQCKNNCIKKAMLLKDNMWINNLYLLRSF